MTYGRVAQVGLALVWLSILGWEILGGITSQPCRIDVIQGFNQVRATCQDGVPHEGRVDIHGGRHDRTLVVGDTIRRSPVWGGFRRDGVIKGYGNTLLSAFFLFPMIYLAGKMLRPPTA